jgi:hypothetical protein
MQKTTSDHPPCTTTATTTTTITIATTTITTTTTTNATISTATTTATAAVMTAATTAATTIATMILPLPTSTYPHPPPPSPTRLFGVHQVSNYQGQTCRLSGTGNQLVNGASIADGDGGEGTMWMPESMMKTRFIFALVAAQFSLVCTTSGTAFYTTAGMSDTANRVSITIANADGATNAGASWWSPGGTYAAGTYVETTVPCYIIADGSSAQDENVVYGG